MGFSRFKNRFSRKSIVYIYILILFLGSVVPIGNRSSDILMDNYTLDIRWDYLLHAILYLPLPLILMYGLRHFKSRVMIRIILISILIPVLFEFIQMGVPYRNFNINDLMANSIGVILGWIVLLFLRIGRSSPGTK
jgi:glycopeptide antibiotics resistance protein